MRELVDDGGRYQITLYPYPDSTGGIGASTDWILYDAAGAELCTWTWYYLTPAEYPPDHAYPDTCDDCHWAGLFVLEDADKAEGASCADYSGAGLELPLAAIDDGSSFAGTVVDYRWGYEPGEAPEIGTFIGAYPSWTVEMFENFHLVYQGFGDPP